jgi:hypothetical protein
MSWHIIGEAMSLVTWWAFRDRIIGKFRRSKKTEVAPVAAAQAVEPATESTDA